MIINFFIKIMTAVLVGDDIFDTGCCTTFLITLGSSDIARASLILLLGSQQDVSNDQDGIQPPTLAGTSKNRSHCISLNLIKVELP